MTTRGSGSGTRTATAKSEATRARVLDAAARVLAREGYSGTRLTDVARQAEIQAPAIYYYFASREELIEEVAGTGADLLVARVEQAVAALPDGAGPLDQMAAAADAHLDFIMTAPDYARAVLRNTEQYPADADLRHLATVQRYHRRWSAMLREAKKQGLIDAEIDVTIARHLVLGALNSAMEWWVPGRMSKAKVVTQTQTLLRQTLTGS